MLGKNSKTIVLFIIIVGVFAVMAVFLPGKFLTVINFQSMSSQIPEFGLLALAMMLAMMTGGIDLSVVSITNLTGVVAAIILTRFISPQMGEGQIILVIILAILAAIAASLVCGFMNGFLIVYVGVPPILATLGTMELFLGIAVVITKGHGVTGFPDKFLYIGSGTIAMIPVPLIIFIICTLIVALALNKTSLGFSIQMLGSNPVAARFAGINNNNVLIKTYLMTGLLAGVSSIIMISRVNSMRPGYGYAYLLMAVLVIILGGVNPSGGFGTVSGVVLGVIILQLLQSGFNILALSPFFKKFIWGFMLLFIMVINFIIAKYQQRSRKLKIRA
ncbi:MAG: ABC transporter permease [Candidatus Humimicrobiaceae bacterium]